MSDYLRLIHRRALKAAEPALVQLWFDTGVLDRYRADTSCQVMRTDSAGRVRKQGSWSLDFGIAPDDSLIHASWGAMAHVPEAEREHWSMHASGPPMSENFLKMQMSPGSCFDDGDLRSW